MGKIKILIIDDEKDFLSMLGEQLGLENYDVFTALDGEEGIAKAKSHKPGLVICDVRMPKKDGFEVLKVLRQDANFSAPFIMLTAVDDFDKVKKAYDNQVDFYVTKPVELNKLLKNIRLLLNLSKNRAE